MNTEVIKLPRVSDEVKVARQAVKIERARSDREVIIALLRNPAFEVLASYIILEILQKTKFTEGGMWGNIEEGAAMTSIVGLIGLQQIAPLIPDIVKASGDALGALTKLVPAIASLGA